MQTRPEYGRYDVIVAGARVAGASTAMLLARRGLRVLVVDPARPGADTLSTHALMRGGVLQLSRWGVLEAVRAAGTPAIRHTTFRYGSDEVRVEIKARDGVDALYAPRRTVLDPLLVAAARGAGAEVLYGASVLEVTRDARGRVHGVIVQTADGWHGTVGANMVVGADGVRSRVSGLVGAAVEVEGAHAAAAAYGYWRNLPSDGYDWRYAPGLSIGTIPTNGDRSCVFVSMSTERFRERLSGGLEDVYYRALAEVAPDVADVVAAQEPTRIRGFAGRPGHLRRSHGPGWALVGDAGFFRDPITAHGITDALRDAELLARAVAVGTDAALAAYQEARDSVARGLLEVSDRVASFSWTLDEAQALHLEFSRRMNRSAQLVAAFDDPSGAQPPEPAAPIDARIAATV